MRLSGFRVALKNEIGPFLPDVVCLRSKTAFSCEITFDHKGKCFLVPFL